MFRQPHARQLIVGLKSQCHADKCAGYHDHRYRLYADDIHLSKHKRPDLGAKNAGHAGVAGTPTKAGELPDLTYGRYRYCA